MSYTDQKAYARDLDAYKRGEIVRTTPNEWAQKLVGDLAEATGLDIEIVTTGRNSGSGRAWASTIFPTQAGSRSNCAFYNYLTDVRIKIGARSLVTIYYNLEAGVEGKSAVSVRDIMGTQIFFSLIAQTYPINDFTTAPPLHRIPQIRKTIVAHMLDNNMVSDPIRLARCLRELDRADADTLFALGKYETAIQKEREARQTAEAHIDALKICTRLYSVGRKQSKLLRK